MNAIITLNMRMAIGFSYVVFRPFINIMVSKVNSVSVFAFAPESKEYRVSKQTELGFQAIGIRGRVIKSWCTFDNNSFVEDQYLV